MPTQETKTTVPYSRGGLKAKTVSSPWKYILPQHNPDKRNFRYGWIVVSMVAESLAGTRQL